jgi:hypothetical protein
VDQKQQQTAVTYASIALHTSLNHDVKHQSESLKCVKKSEKKIENKMKKEKSKDGENDYKIISKENGEVLYNDCENHGYSVNDSYITEITNTEFYNSENRKNEAEKTKFDEERLNENTSKDDYPTCELLPQNQITEICDRKGKYYVIQKDENLDDDDKYVSKKVSQKEKLNQDRVPKPKIVSSLRNENDGNTKQDKNTIIKFVSKSSDSNNYLEIYQKFSKTDLFQFRNFDPKMKMIIFEILVRYRNQIYLKKYKVRDRQTFDIDYFHCILYLIFLIF